ncbi:conserved hypothetical protein [Methylorubrum populi BJ001]|jgi:hypothetical protein|uniref:Uncharacterized protein n=1 Tax=Methylorubrum populi (strain ATCC BAA-705 / NCIMB 13946 / BJ001) TaxID=441620 RepID=B1ZGY7_METPB|nr:hypothetical protein [Methylorubrum populi]ACB82665.1 conserved hypothetical protein [Methylorubrum populi BJ001]OAH32851.1 hypothetical protein AX289_16310 [Methylorubrum populi]PZP67100.1 MAG: hypothetical protein DI590_21825 [Methylorubrum populi]
MADFTDLIARAVSPSMSREEREQVYTVVRQAVQRLQDRENLAGDDPRILLQRHLIEETIRDIEFDIVRFLTLRKIDQARAAQNAEYEAQFAKKR